MALCYGAWAVQRPSGLGNLLAEASAVPLLVVLLRWLHQTDQGRTGAPEQVLVKDPVIRLGVLAWALCFAATVLAAASS